jgi:hypothetical protein
MNTTTAKAKIIEIIRRNRRHRGTLPIQTEEALVELILDAMAKFYLTDEGKITFFAGRFPTLAEPIEEKGDIIGITESYLTTVKEQESHD